MSANNGAEILDYVEDWRLTTALQQRYQRQLGALGTYWHGLEYLYTVVGKAQARYSPTVKVFPSVRDRLSMCMFDWYAVSACNMVLLAGWIAECAGLTSMKPHDYRKTVIPGVLKWRHKVAAHPALLDPRPEDKGAVEQLSVSNALGLSNGRLVVPAYVLKLSTRSLKQTSSASISPWSLTEVHEQLRARYEGPAQS